MAARISRTCAGDPRLVHLPDARFARFFPLAFVAGVRDARFCCFAERFHAEMPRCGREIHLRGGRRGGQDARSAAAPRNGPDFAGRGNDFRYSSNIPFCLCSILPLTRGAFLNVRTSCIGGASIFFPPSSSAIVIS